MVFKAFPIANFESGLDRSREPWLLPKDAFSKLSNMHVRRGVLEKRLGYVKWNAITETAVTHPIMAIETYYNSSGVGILVAFSKVSMWVYDATISTGAFVSGSTYVIATVGDTDFTAIGASANTVGILFVATGSGGGTTGVASGFIKQTTTHPDDDFTGDGEDFFWVENWQNRLFIVNNKDPLRSYDGTDIDDVNIQFAGGGPNITMSALLVFVHKNHLIVLNPTEDGTDYPHRARWSAASNPDDWTNDGFVDAPTIGHIVAAEFLGDDLIVLFERAIWKLKFTANAILPFKWEKMVDTDGTFSTFALSAFSNELIALGPTKILSIDGIDVDDINKKLPDIVLQVNPLYFHMAYSIVIEETEEILFSYPSGVSKINNKTLAFNYENNSWSEYDFGFNCFGFWDRETTETWDDITATWDSLVRRWDDVSRRAGYPLTFAGDTSGNIFQLNEGGQDNGSSISLEVETKNMNPYMPDGKKARLGYIDFLIERNTGISLTVDFYVNDESTPYQSLTLDADGTESKVIRRLDSGAIANFHRININHDESNQTVRIHAIIPWFEAVDGRLEVL